MTQTTGIEFERLVADAIRKLDYEVTTEPMQNPKASSWLGKVSSWLMEPSNPPIEPDMLVTFGNREALVEAKAYPVLLGPVIQARHFADYLDVPAIVCVPDDAFQEIPYSVQEWAEANDIVLSSIGNIGDNLNKVLQSTGT